MRRGHQSIRFAPLMVPMKWPAGPAFHGRLQAAFMSVAGLIVLYVVTTLAHVARYFDVGPRWLRQFKIGKSTIY